jgi:hypothetical protein
MMERLLTEDDVSQVTRRAVSTLQKDRCAGGGIPFIRIGRLVRYRESDVAAYLASLPAHNSTTEADAARWSRERCVGNTARPAFEPRVSR